MNAPKGELWVAKSFHFSTRPLPGPEHLTKPHNNDDDDLIVLHVMQQYNEDDGK